MNTLIAMVRPSDDEIADFTSIAVEIQEILEERGSRVDSAMDVDAAFKSGHARAWLRRDLVIEAASRKASVLGVDFRAVNGSGREFRTYEDMVSRHYRLRKATSDDEGTLTVPVSSDSALTHTVEDPDARGLWTLEPWVFGIVLDENGLLQSAFLGEVVGVIDGMPGSIDFGTVVDLELMSPPPSRGFQPSDDEYLPDLDDGEEDEIGGLGSA